MENIQKAIELAIKGDWKVQISPKTEEGIKVACEILAKQRRCLLDPEFWKALGKTLGWREETYGVCVEGIAGGLISHTYQMLTWRSQWVNFIDHLAEGKTVESFFADLLAQK